MMFTNKVVLITGASAGIGGQTAIHFSKLGANLVMTARNQEKLNAIVEMCVEASPTKTKPLALIADVTKPEDNEKVIKSTIDHWKQLDVLVNNAGILELGTIETTNLDQFDRIMNTNIRGVYHLTMLATPHLLKSKGNIVNVSSVAGLRSFPNLLSYCISKAALDQFTRCVSLELAAKGVRVNAVNPGAIETDIFLGCMTVEESEAYMERCKETHAIGRPGYTYEVSSAIVFLAGEGASNITGATLPVDGGRHAMCPR